MVKQNEHNVVIGFVPLRSVGINHSFIGSMPCTPGAVAMICGAVDQLIGRIGAKKKHSICFILSGPWETFCQVVNSDFQCSSASNCRLHSQLGSSAAIRKKA